MHHTHFKALKSILFAVLAVLVFNNNAFAQTPATTTPATTAAAPVAVGVTGYIDKFFKNYDKLGTEKAVKDIFKTNPNIDSTRLTGLIVKVDSMRAAIGKYQGKELIMQRKASNSLILYSYLVKHEIQPARVTFMFYKPKNEWMIYRLFFDADVDSELAEAAKVTGKP